MGDWGLDWELPEYPQLPKLFTNAKTAKKRKHKEYIVTDDVLDCPVKLPKLSGKQASAQKQEQQQQVEAAKGSKHAAAAAAAPDSAADEQLRKKLAKQQSRQQLEVEVQATEQEALGLEAIDKKKKETKEKALPDQQIDKQQQQQQGRDNKQEQKREEHAGPATASKKRKKDKQQAAVNGGNAEVPAAAAPAGEAAEAAAPPKKSKNKFKQQAFLEQQQAQQQAQQQQVQKQKQEREQQPKEMPTTPLPPQQQQVQHKEQQQQQPKQKPAAKPQQSTPQPATSKRSKKTAATGAGHSPAAAAAAASPGATPTPTSAAKASKQAAAAAAGGGSAAGGSKLLQQFAARLQGSRFRQLNEALYTQPGDESFDMLQQQPELFQQYHEGFREQVKAWPNQPLDAAIAWLKGKPQEMVVADFGCGDARLAATVTQTVHSLDLVAAAPGVIACNMAATPLDTCSCDAAVFSLALMGVDYGAFLAEAARVVKQGGWLWIAEVRSRFAGSSGGEDFRPFLGCLQQLGFKLVKQDASNRMFVVFVLKKQQGVEAAAAKAIRWPPLKACMYKKR